MHKQITGVAILAIDDIGTLCCTIGCGRRDTTGKRVKQVVAHEYLFNAATMCKLLAVLTSLLSIIRHCHALLKTGCSANTFLGVGPTLAMPPPTGVLCYTPRGVLYTPLTVLTNTPILMIAHPRGVISTHFQVLTAVLSGVT